MYGCIMNNEVIINVVKVVGDSICVTDEDGKKVYDVINDALSDGKKIIVSFDSVTDLTSATLMKLLSNQNYQLLICLKMMWSF